MVAGQLLSYSLRRVAPAWGAIAGLSEPDKLTLGNWIDKGVGTGQTPAHRLRRSTQLKWALLGAARAFGHKTRWQEVQHGAMQAQLETDLTSGAAEVINPDLPQQDDATLQVRPSFWKGAAKNLKKKRVQPPLPVAGAPSSKARPAPPAAAAADVVEVDEPAVDPSDPPQTDDPDEFFDRLARARWSSAGHSGHAEPASLVHRRQHGSGNLWLGGLPCSSDEVFLKPEAAADLLCGQCYAGNFGLGWSLCRAVPSAIRPRVIQWS